MTSTFYTDVESMVGPVLEELGFVLDEVDDSPDEGGFEWHIVYYRSSDCRLQIYYSSREGEINCMIAPLDALNEFGLNSKKWHFISRFSKRPDIPLQEQLQIALAEVQSYENRLDWVKRPHYSALRRRARWHSRKIRKRKLTAFDLARRSADIAPTP